MLIERLDPRLLAYTDSPDGPPVGVDTTFGTAGHVSFRRNFTAAGPMAVTGSGAVFVAGEQSYSDVRIPMIVKLLQNGKIDTTFGNSGYARLPFKDKSLQSSYDFAHEGYNYEPSFDGVTAMAYDTVAGDLYVATTRHAHYGDGTTLGVTRLTGHGYVDTGYGDGTVAGTFTYVPPLPTGKGPGASASVEKINVLANRQVILGVDRQTRTANKLRAPADQSLALFKLRANGTRDPKYGTHGTTQLIGGTVGILSQMSSTMSTRPIQRAFFNDMQTDAAGNTTVTMRYENGVLNFWLAKHLDNEEATLGKFEIKTRAVSTTGVSDPTKAYSWTLEDTGTDTSTDASEVVVHAIPFATFDGRRFRALMIDGEDLSETGTLYTMRPGVRPTSQPLTPNTIDFVAGMTRSANGHYFVYSDITIAGYNSDFTPDNTFGQNGLANNTSDNFLHTDYTGSYFTDNRPLADDQGRFLVFTGLGLTRFA